MLEANVVQGVHRIENAYTNFYLVEDGGRLTVVDTGVPTSWDAFQQALEALGRTPSDVEAVVLTHGHYDHVGFAERARTALGVPVYVHENDVPLARHPLMYGRERTALAYLVNPGALPIIASLARNRAFFVGGVKQPTRYSDGTLDVPGSPRVVFSPGHTLGHCALHLPDRDALLVGDAFVMLDPYTGFRGPKLVSRAATADTERNLASLDALAATGATVCLTGHGPPWTGGVAEAVRIAREKGVT